MLLITRDPFGYPYRRDFTPEDTLKIPEEGVIVGGFLSLGLSPQQKYQLHRGYPWDDVGKVRRHLLWCARKAVMLEGGRYYPLLNVLSAMEDYLDGRGSVGLMFLGQPYIPGNVVQYKATSGNVWQFTGSQLGGVDGRGLYSVQGKFMGEPLYYRRDSFGPHSYEPVSGSRSVWPFVSVILAFLLGAGLLLGSLVSVD